VKLAQLSTRYPPGLGGVERHVAEISAELGARGHSVRVLTSDLYREFPWERLPPSVPRFERVPFGTVERLPVWSLPSGLHYPFFRRLETALRADPVEVVHAHTYGTNQVAVAHRHHRHTGTPFVLTAHFHPIDSIEGGWFRHRLRAFYDRRLAAPIVADAARLIVQSREEERLLRKLGIPLPPVRIVPPGYTPLPPPADGQEFRRRYGIAGPYVLFVGRLASNKGLLPLLEAFAPLAHRDPAASLVLVGPDGGMKVAFEARVRALGIEARVKLIGWIDDEAMLAAAYREARFFVLPSEYEAFGLVLLEALGQGTAVIATRVGGIPEFVEDGRAGLLVPPGEPGPLREAIERLWADPGGAAAMGAYGRERIVPQYRWGVVADRLAGIYREALDG